MNDDYNAVLAPLDKKWGRRVTVEDWKALGEKHASALTDDDLLIIEAFAGPEARSAKEEVRDRWNRPAPPSHPVYKSLTAEPPAQATRTRISHKLLEGLAAGVVSTIKKAIEPLKQRLSDLELQVKTGPHADGLGIDDLVVEQTSERSFCIKVVRAGRVKDIGTAYFPVEIYRGVHVDGKTYDRGDCVTLGGSEWHCNEPTFSKPGDASKAWTLKVKRGRDGKDLR